MLGKNSLFYSENNTEVNSWFNLIVMTLNVAQIKPVLKQGQQMIQEQNSITSTQKKRLSDNWHKRLISYLGLANQGSSNDPKHFDFGLRDITKMRNKKIFFSHIACLNHSLLFLHKTPFIRLMNRDLCFIILVF